ncbi:MAG: hypothetical protein R2865_00705 [Deinococcales bacterium]
MGSENGDLDEKPVHRQEIKVPYWLDETEVTREAYIGGVYKQVVAQERQTVNIQQIITNQSTG